MTSRTDPPGTVGARMRDVAVTDDEPTPTTVRDRLTTAGLSAERIEQHMTAGRVRVDGGLVADLTLPHPRGRGSSSGASELRRRQSGPWRRMMPSVRRVLDDPGAIGLWLALTLAGIIAAFVATDAIWAVISWAIGGIAAFVLAAVRARRGG